jgi:hypothetical protein
LNSSFLEYACTIDEDDITYICGCRGSNYYGMPNIALMTVNNTEYRFAPSTYMLYPEVNRVFNYMKLLLDYRIQEKRFVH